MIYLVRHAHAGTKGRWPGPDHLRPLSESGRRESRGLLIRFGGVRISAITSSPSARCIQTVEELANQRLLQIKIDDRLTADADVGRTLDWLLAEDHVDLMLCTHGELIGELFRCLRRQGAPIHPRAEWPKGSTWRLDIAAGVVMGATYLPPLAISRPTGRVPAPTG